MANKNDHLVVGLYATEDLVRAAVDAIKEWDVWDHDVRLGAIAVMVYDESKKGGIHFIEKGQRSTKTGAGWGTAIGATIGILSGGIALVPGMAAGAAIGGALGALNHRNLGLTDAQHAKILAALKDGGAAVGAMADDFEVDAVVAKMEETGGNVDHYKLPEETAAAVTMAAAAQADAEDAIDEAADDVDEADVAEATKAVEVEVPDAAPETVEKVSKLAAVSGLSAGAVAKLDQADVDKASALLAACATPEGRAELSAATGIDEETLLTAAKKIDLMRVKGVGAKYAELLLACGVDTVPELATRNPDNLAKKMAEVNAKQQIVDHSPSAETVAGWVDQAKEMPRMIYY